MNDLMIDLETMGKSNNAPIFELAAAFFNPETAEVGETFRQLISLESCAECGLTMDASTVLWWMEQADDARPKSDWDFKPLPIVLMAFHDFVKANSSIAKVMPWGNGATFDLGILKNAFNACHAPTPWLFFNELDVRTVVRLGRMVGFDPKKDMPFEGVKHSALDDVTHQIKYVSAIVQRLTAHEKYSG
jgi:hypothetical protein